MDRKISEKEIHYLIDHLDILYYGASLREYIYTGDSRKKNTLYLPLSEKSLDTTKVITIGDIPVLFPCSDSDNWYSEENNQIIFHHDILKSAFYLLSSYQEYYCHDRDADGRFPWKSSIQYRLEITQKPVVNYYFEIILEAFEKFCILNDMDFKRKTRIAPLLLLSHDVDRIKKYSIRNLAFSLMQLLGLKPGSPGAGRQLRIILDHATGILLCKKDPYWNFNEMTDLEKELNISSTWYFLEKTNLQNSRYHFRDSKIRDLIHMLESKGHEIGIHGTLESSSDQQVMIGEIQGLNEVSKNPVVGIRQHFLKYNNPLTHRIQSAAGLDYDSSLGFAEQIGFRNSYAYPFRLFDFDKEEAVNLWQIPLNVMEVSLMGYMKVPIADIQETIQPVLHEVTKFKGVFSLLWHNCRLDEEELPGVNLVYRQILQDLMSSGFISLTGQEALNEFISDGVSGSNS
jgi:peptidoglycan/xylan/chitin deacetylase (PgdA/CDA1 family)